MDSPFNLKEMRSLLEMLEKFDVYEFNLERDEERLFLKRGGQPVISNPGSASPTYFGGGERPIGPAGEESFRSLAPYVSPPVKPSLAPAEGVNKTELAATPTSTPKVNTKPFIEISSPMVGTFYRRPAVDAEPYVVVGDTVKKGQVLCIVEAMKLMNEIESDVSGKIVEVCLEDGQMVEYGEVLFRIEPA